MKTFWLEIITPEKVAFSGEVEMVSVPSVEGTLGILANHIPLVAKLTEGELKIVKEGKEDFYSLGGGFLEVTSKKVMILVTKALNADEIDEKKILEAKAAAEEALRQKPKGEALISAQALLRSTLIDLKVKRRRKGVTYETKG
jgi:F-type H+-transporting ATPase subunit epsilon